MIYAEDLSEETLAQYNKAVAQGYVLKSALMADAHLGYTLPIGGVVLTKSFIVPSWVGYDIGCGVSSVRLSCDAKEVKKYSTEIAARILEKVPVGAGVYSKRCHNFDFRFVQLLSDEGARIYKECGQSKHLGSLGGGNHFIEIGVNGNDGSVWLTVHTGSRGFGHKLASYYMKAAHPSRKLKEGSYPLEYNSELGRMYYNDQVCASNFATQNREVISENVIKCISKVLGKDVVANRSTLVNQSHNHVRALYNSMFIHRKGATLATEGQYGVIPGNMRDGVYLVKGCGVEDSLCSASHGAGRAYSRRKAKKELSLKKFKEDTKGVICQVSEDSLDESPDAYKDFGKVMELQKDLVEIVASITPIINVKGCL